MDKFKQTQSDGPRLTTDDSLFRSKAAMRKPSAIS
jgi:hypothetical protein